MKMLLIPFGMVLLAAGAASAQPSADAKAAVSRLFQAIRANDAATYADVGREVGIMVIADVGVPMPLADARKIFVDCSVISLSEPKPLGDVSVSIVTTVLTCAPPAPKGPISVDVMTDGKVVHLIYPGGMEHFHREPPQKPTRR